MSANQDEMKERRKLAGSTSGMTYHSVAMRDIALESGGRFSKADAISKPTVTGQTPAVTYPRASGPWVDPVQVPDEPPLGFSVEHDFEPCGTAVEIEASLAATEPMTKGDVPCSTSVAHQSSYAEASSKSVSAAKMATPFTSPATAAAKSKTSGDC